MDLFFSETQCEVLFLGSLSPCSEGIAEGASVHCAPEGLRKCQTFMKGKGDMWSGNRWQAESRLLLFIALDNTSFCSAIRHSPHTETAR